MPVVTFINKMDRLDRKPLDLLDEIERVLGMTPVAWNWPIGGGPTFQRVYDLRTRQVLRFDRLDHGGRRVPVFAADLHDQALVEQFGPLAYAELGQDVELLTGAGTASDRAKFRAGELTPVCFGSALTNFGVERLPFTQARWITGDAPAVNRMRWPTQGTMRCQDREGQPVALFASSWELEYCAKHNPGVSFMLGSLGGEDQLRESMQIPHGSN